MTTVHRLLDDAFTGVTLTPDVQDLKEEIRANLEARASELQTNGAGPDEAARRAFDELGDVQALVAAAADDEGPGRATPVQKHSQAALRNKVRPRPLFVIGIVAASFVAPAGALAAILGLADDAVAATLGGSAALALAVGWIVGSSLAQETTTNHPMPRGRAAGYGLGVALAVGALALAGATALLPLAKAWYVAAGLLLVVGAALLSVLGATQTNRKKTWAREAEKDFAIGNRFDQDPAAAARFGIYTAAIWLVAFLVFALVGAFVTWAWAWLVFVAASAVWMFMLARMLFGEPTQGDSPSGH